MSSTRGLFRHALVFGTGPALQKLAALLLLPYFTHFLSPEDYGTIELVAFWTGLFVVLFGCEYRSGFLWRYAGAAAARRPVIATVSVVFAGVVALAAGAVFAAVGGTLLGRQMHVPPSALLVRVLAAGLVFDLAGVVVLAVLQAEQRAARMVTLGLVQFVIDALLKILLVAHRGMGVDGFFVASAAASVVNTSLALWSARDLLTARATVGDARRECGVIVRYTAPLLLGALAYLLVRRIDRPMAVSALSLAAVGVYGRAARLVQFLLDFYLVPFQRSFDVWRLEVHARSEDLGQVARTYRWFVLGAGLVATAVATFGCDLFTGLAAAEYSVVREQVPLLNVAMLCQCAATVVASAFFVSQRTAVWMRVFVVGLLVEIVLVWLLAPPFGVAGIALALGATHAFLWWAAAHFGRTVWPVPYRHGRAVAIVACATAASLARVPLPAGPLWLALPIDAALVLAYVALALPSAGVTRAEWTAIVERVRSRVFRR